MISDFLTFLKSKGRHYTDLAPDENFARELMQLFTVGLHELHRNGTVRRDDATGEALSAYDNHDVVSFARAWTGFDRQESRTNIENYDGTSSGGRNNARECGISPPY